MNKQIVRCAKAIGDFKENTYYITYVEPKSINGESVKLYQIYTDSFKQIGSQRLYTDVDYSNETSSEYFTEDVFYTYFRRVIPFIKEGMELECVNFTTFWNKDFYALFKSGETYEVKSVSTDGCDLIDSNGNTSSLSMISIAYNFKGFDFIDTCVAIKTIGFKIGDVYCDEIKSIIFRKDQIYRFEECRNGNVKVFINKRFINITKDIFDLYFK